MLSKLEKELLSSQESITESILELIPSNELVENLSYFTSFDVFKESEFYKNLILSSLTPPNKEVDRLKELYVKNNNFYLPCPRHLTKQELFDLLENTEFAKYVFRSDFTDNYFHFIARDREALLKYKDLIDFNWVVMKGMINNNDTFIDLFYDELSEVCTNTIINAMRVSDEECPYYCRLLTDKLEKISKASFKDNDVVQEMLKSVYYLPCDGTYNKFFEDLYSVFSDEYIKQNIDLFNPYHLIRANRLSEEIFQTIIDKNAKSINTDYSFKKLALKYNSYSGEFLFKNLNIFKSTTSLYMQKNIMYVYKMALLTPNRLNRDKIFAYNTYLTDDDIKLLAPKVTDEIYKYEPTPLLLKRCALLGKLRGEKND